MNNSSQPPDYFTISTTETGHSSTNVFVFRDQNSSLHVSGDILLNEESLSERLERIEKILNIPSRNIEMEEKYPRLKELFIEYTALLEKYKTWEVLKK